VHIGEHNTREVLADYATTSTPLYVFMA
jgi:hypothetical protein